MTKQRKRIRIKGIVQGVGFRPFVFRLAERYGLTGFVLNDSHGVLVEIEGNGDFLESFQCDLQNQAPPMSRITAIEAITIPTKHDFEFKIQASRSGQMRQALISPDLAVCNDCLQELFNPTDRRYHYPFINCTNCGPRYTITSDIPYDRRNTSMLQFTMCQQCQQEYDDPHNRRFHAQPNACPVCGPHLELLDTNGSKIPTNDLFLTVAMYLRQGRILALRGLGGFHLCVDAQNPEAVRRLRERKHREEKPMAVMSPFLQTIEQYAEITDLERQLLLSPQCPIVLLKKKYPFILAENVAPNNLFIGVMLPYTPIHHLLLRPGFTALVMTSGNRSEEPIAIDNEEALYRLGDIADYFLMHNRDVLVRADDSVVRIIRNRMMPIRRARGLVPMPIFLPVELPQILAVGAELKNTICLTMGRNAFLSQHIGDLENLATFEFFKECIAHFQRIHQIQPGIIAYDLHPEYLSTKWALEQNTRDRLGVQHHHAHIAACMAENHCDEPVIGLAMDGTGYGPDGTIWGGEILIADYRTFERVGHFEYVPMPGGAAAIKEPWRMAFGYLLHHQEPSIQAWPLFADIDPKKLEILTKIIANRINSPLTSSLGRLFDVISALVGLGKTVAFEGQAALKLEMAMYQEGASEAAHDVTSYPYEIVKTGSGYLISVKPMFKVLFADYMSALPVAIIARKFHQQLLNIFCDMCGLVRNSRAITRVALSGGCFQNHYLATNLPERLTQLGFTVLTHQLVPTNDAGISLGQAMIAAYQRNGQGYAIKNLNIGQYGR